MMEVYLQVFVNFKPNNWARLFPMAEFAYNNAKNISTNYKPHELNCGYYSHVSYKKDVDPYSKSKSADNLTNNLRELINIYQNNLQHAQDLQKRAQDKDTKPKSFTPGHKVWVNSKYIKIKRNQKLEAKFFRPFQVLHPLGKQPYKLKLPKNWRIYDVFYVLLLEQVTIKKGWVDNNVTEFETGNDKEYEVEGIRNSAVYTKKLVANHLAGLYYLISWKDYPEKENT